MIPVRLCDGSTPTTTRDRLAFEWFIVRKGNSAYEQASFPDEGPFTGDGSLIIFAVRVAA
jgi:hypothetical protein